LDLLASGGSFNRQEGALARAAELTASRDSPLAPLAVLVVGVNADAESEQATLGSALNRLVSGLDLLQARQAGDVPIPGASDAALARFWQELTGPGKVADLDPNSAQGERL